jgi:L-aspartate oxidase
VNAGDGLVYRPAAQALVSEGPLRVAELIEWGADFDREARSRGKSGAAPFLRTREGAHSLARILHANGDATGAEISRALVTFARVHKRIRFSEWTRVSSLLVADGRVIGADLASAEASRSALGAGGRRPHRSRVRVAARSVLIATGGAGQVYSDTTNPAVATGEGLALAATAGAEIADMEFYQFHPTALALEGAPRFLISEALRGEGAWLRNDQGERFMERYHPLLELAPRDVVARAIAREGMVSAPGLDSESGDRRRPQASPVSAGKSAQDGAAPCKARAVYLDMRHVRNIAIPARFPGISAFLAQYGLDLRRDLIPIRPAAHYLMGGIRTDLGGRTGVKGLYAAGEAACTGLHGTNRLASNSLLEGLVFGARAAQSMVSDSLPLVLAEAPGPAPQSLAAKDTRRVEEFIAALRASMWTHAGLLREESSLRRGLADQAVCEAGLAEIAAQHRSSRRLSEAQSLCRVARAILVSALARTESRGAHFRTDFPRHDDANLLKHSIIGGEGQVRFEAW